MEAPPPFLTVRLARDAADLDAAARLRHEVFVAGMGAAGGAEADAFDPWCEHVVLVDGRRDPARRAHVVGTCRLLTGAGAAGAGRFYSEAEFDILPLRRSGRRLLELGRTCLAPEFRGGWGLGLLWRGVAERVAAHDAGLLFGAASLPGTDPAPLAPALALLHARHLAPDWLRVRALAPGRVEMSGPEPAGEARLDALRRIPPLLKSYLRLGGVVGDGAWIDRVFNCTDVFVALDIPGMPAAQRRRWRA